MDKCFKRVCAYIIDIFIVTFVVTLITGNSLINPYFEKYNEKYEDYVELLNDYKDEEITDEEYESKSSALSYDLAKLNVVTTGVTIGAIVLYFGLFQYYYDGQTLGKKLFKIKIVDKDNKKLSLPLMLLRAIILNNVIFRLMLVVGLYLMKENPYQSYSYVISIIEGVIETAILVMIVLRQDGRGLHDVLCQSKVIDINETNEKEEVGKEEIKEEKVEAKKEVKTIEVKEKETKPKKTNVKKNTSKKQTKSKKSSSQKD